MKLVLCPLCQRRTWRRARANPVLWPYLNYTPEQRREQGEVLAQRERREQHVRKRQWKRMEERDGRLIPVDRSYGIVAKGDNESLCGNRKLNQARFAPLR